MTARPSIPVLLFTVADAIARGGMPEPIRVELSERHGLCLDLASQVDLEKWARRIKVDDYRRTTASYTDRAGVSRTVSTAWSQWHGEHVELRVSLPLVEADDADLPTPASPSGGGSCPNSH